MEHIANSRGKINCSHLAFYFPQPCPSAGRMLAASKSRLDYYQPIRSDTTTNSTNWNLRRILVRWRNTQPHLNGAQRNMAATFSHHVPYIEVLRDTSFLQGSFAGLFCIPLLQVSFAGLFCIPLLQVSFYISRSLVTYIFE